MPRIYQSTSLNANSTVLLDEAARHHIARVLRAKVGDELTLFNGTGGEYAGVITQIDKKNVLVELKAFIVREAESPLDIYLAQGISRGERMDFVMQKAVELGVKKIFPLKTERCNVKLDEERGEKRVQHWQSVIIGACEQSGRNTVPTIEVPQTLQAFLNSAQADWKLVLAPTADKKLADYKITQGSKVILLIGPEGGLSDNEIEQAIAQGYSPLQLGPRILRTETAALAAVAGLQTYAGDF